MDQQHSQRRRSDPGDSPRCAQRCRANCRQPLGHFARQSGDRRVVEPVVEPQHLAGAQVAQFDELGFVVLEDQFTEQELAQVLAVTDAHDARTGQMLAGMDGERFSIAERGAIVVDNSSGFRMDPDVPLVVAEVNPEAMDGARKGIIANPNCTTMVVMLPVKALHDAFGLTAMVATSFQAAGGAGHHA